MLVDRISKEKLLENLEAIFGYDFHRFIYEIWPDYTYGVSCMGSVSEAIIAYLDSHDFQSAIRHAVPIGGDSDTIDAMTGAIAQAAYEMSKALADYCHASRSPCFHRNVFPLSNPVNQFIYLWKPCCLY